LFFFFSTIFPLPYAWAVKGAADRLARELSILELVLDQVLAWPQSPYEFSFGFGERSRCLRVDGYGLLFLAGSPHSWPSPSGVSNFLSSWSGLAGGGLGVNAGKPTAGPSMGGPGLDHLKERLSEFFGDYAVNLGRVNPGDPAGKWTAVFRFHQEERLKVPDAAGRSSEDRRKKGRVQVAR